MTLASNMDQERMKRLDISRVSQPPGFFSFLLSDKSHYILIIRSSLTGLGQCARGLKWSCYVNGIHGASAYSGNVKANSWNFNVVRKVV